MLSRVFEAWIGVGVMLFLVRGFARGHPSPLIDLTYEYFSLTPTFPSQTTFQIHDIKEIQLSPGLRYRTEDFTMSEHAGTHMDAPIHFLGNNMSVANIPVEQLVGPGVVIDITRKAFKNPDAMVEMEDVTLWEKQYGRIPKGSVVLMYSGWGERSHNQIAYNGGSEPSNLHFPGFHESVCQWLVSERLIAGLGVDTLSVDPGFSPNFPCHVHLSAAGRYGLENVANVDKLPSTGTTIRAFPMKIRGGTGAPTRIIATLDQGSHWRPAGHMRPPR